MLSINYRVGKHEVSRLGLVTSDNYVRIFKAAVDGELIEEAMQNIFEEKKSNLIEPVISNSSNGD
ncbi:MAG: hypothetical protein IH899_01410 [Planctomycetes bacterium]|nr:hypothetical protein [Planctomycetota bacterium]